MHWLVDRPVDRLLVTIDWPVDRLAFFVLHRRAYVLLVGQLDGQPTAFWAICCSLLVGPTCSCFCWCAHCRSVLLFLLCMLVPVLCSKNLCCTKWVLKTLPPRQTTTISLLSFFPLNPLPAKAWADGDRGLLWAVNRSFFWHQGFQSPHISLVSCKFVSRNFKKFQVDVILEIMECYLFTQGSVFCNVLNRTVISIGDSKESIRLCKKL